MNVGFRKQILIVNFKGNKDKMNKILKDTILTLIIYQIKVMNFLNINPNANTLLEFII